MWARLGSCVRILSCFQRSRRTPYLFLPLVIGLVLYIYSQWRANPWTPSSARTPVARLQTNSDVPSANNEVLLVTAFYPISRAKHTVSEYKRWLTAFLGHIATDVYLYAPAYLVPLVESLRPIGYNLFVNTTFASPFDVPPLARVGRAGFDDQLALDREKHIHGPELFAVWAAKPYFLSAATQANRDRYRLAFWVDAGTLRTSRHAYRRWPEPKRLDEALSTTNAPEDAILIPMDYDPPRWFQKWSPADGPADGAWSEGSFFGGRFGAVDWYARTYYTYFDHWRAKGRFVGKDQTLINGLMLMYPDRFATVWNRDLDAPGASIPKDPREGALGYCSDPWFYYLFWLANEDEKARMNALWSTEWHWDFWIDRAPCRDTRALAMRTVLQRTYGSGWKPPSAPLAISGEPWI